MLTSSHNKDNGRNALDLKRIIVIQLTATGTIPLLVVLFLMISSFQCVFALFIPFFCLVGTFRNYSEAPIPSRKIDSCSIMYVSLIFYILFFVI